MYRVLSIHVHCAYTVVFRSAVVIVCTVNKHKRKDSKGIHDVRLEAESTKYREILPTVKCGVSNLPDSDGKNLVTMQHSHILSKLFLCATIHMQELPTCGICNTGESPILTKRSTTYSEAGITTHIHSSVHCVWRMVQEQCYYAR